MNWKYYLHLFTCILICMSFAYLWSYSWSQCVSVTDTVSSYCAPCFLHVTHGSQHWYLNKARRVWPRTQAQVSVNKPMFLLSLCCRVLHADGVCESVLYGLPLVVRPTTCWQLDWDEMETNNSLFQALCHTLRVRRFVLYQPFKIEMTSLGIFISFTHQYFLLLCLKITFI